ncbi:MAG: OsmC family protein [Anaerolineae bacterium]
MAKTSVRLEQGYRAQAQSRHHQWVIDEPTSEGGTDTAPTPSETVMGALGACVAITIKMYAQRKGWKLERVEVDLENKRLKKEDYPAYTGDAPFVHEVTKRIALIGDLDDEQRERLLEIGTKCPVGRLITEPAFINDLLLENLSE